MKPRLDSSFESWDNFTEDIEKEYVTPGRTSYDAHKKLEPQLIENRDSVSRTAALKSSLTALSTIPTLIGRQVAGRLTTLLHLWATKSAGGLSAVGSPAALISTRVFFGADVTEVAGLEIKKYSVALSSLSNRGGAQPPQSDTLRSMSSVNRRSRAASSATGSAPRSHASISHAAANIGYNGVKNARQRRRARDIGEMSFLGKEEEIDHAESP